MSLKNVRIYYIIFVILFVLLKKISIVVLMSLAQLIWTMYNICKVQASNPSPPQKKEDKYSLLSYKSEKYLLSILII